MTKTTEELKREMYKSLANLKGRIEINYSVKDVQRGADEFDNELEDYLEALRQEAESASARLGYLLKDQEIMRDAYAHQQGLTHAACADARDTWDQLTKAKVEIANLRSANDNGCRVLVTLQGELKEMTRLRGCFETLAVDYTKKSVDLEKRLIDMTANRDELARSNLASTEVRDQLRNKLQAFEFANKSAGEFLQEAQAKVKRQRQSIGQLKNDRNNAQSLAAVNYDKYQKARREASELRKQLGATRIQNETENVAGDELKRFEETSKHVCHHRWHQCMKGAPLVCVKCLAIAIQDPPKVKVTS